MATENTKPKRKGILSRIKEKISVSTQAVAEVVDETMDEVSENATELFKYATVGITCLIIASAVSTIASIKLIKALKKPESIVIHVNKD